MEYATAVTLLFYVIVGILSFVLTVRRPEWGLYALVLVIPFDRPTYVANDMTTIQFSKTILIGLVLALVARRVSLAPLFAPTRRPLLLAAIAVAVVPLISLLHADYKNEAIRQSFKSFEYLAAFVAAAVVGSRLKDGGKGLLRVFSVTTILVAVSAIIEEFGTARSFALVRGHVIPRVAGVLEGPNQLAGYLDIVLPLTLVALFVRSTSPLDRTILTLAFTLGAFSDILTLSRGGIASALVGCCIVIAMSASALRSKTAWRGLLAAAALTVLIVVATGTAGRFSDLTQNQGPGETGLGTRGELWKAAIVLWRSSPLVGIGAGNYELELARAGVTDAQTHANSLPLQTLAEQGLVGEISLVAMVIMQLVFFYRGLVATPMAVGALAATVGFYGHQLFDDLIFFPKVGVECSLLFGAAFTLTHVRKEPVSADASKVNGDP